MKIAVVCPYDIGAHGGVQAQVVGLTQFLRAAGQVAWIVAPGTLAHESVPVRSVGSSIGIRSNDSVAPVALDPRSWRRVRSALRDADIVHIHEPFMPVVSWAALGSTSPQVLTLHADPPRWVSGAYSASRWGLKRVLRRAAAVTAVSPVAAAPMRSLGLDPVLVPNAVEVPSVPPTIGGRGHTVAFVGRDEPRKGLDVLLSAWPQVRARIPDARLTVVTRAKGEQRAGVSYVRDASDDERDEVLARSAVFVAPNRRGESFGITVVEAMVRGCAVVASDLPAFRHVGEGSLAFVPPGNPTALAEAIGALLADEARQAELGNAAATFARRYTWETVGDVYLEMYHNALHS